MDICFISESPVTFRINNTDTNVCLFVCYGGRSQSFSIAISSVMIHTYTEVNGSCVHTLMVEHIPEGFTGKIDSAKINRGW